jgi:hypothetical protein
MIWAYDKKRAQRKVILMAEKSKEGFFDRNVKTDIPENMNSPKYERSDLEFLTDEYKHILGK